MYTIVSKSEKILTVRTNRQCKLYYFIEKKEEKENQTLTLSPFVHYRPTQRELQRELKYEGSKLT